MAKLLNLDNSRKKLAIYALFQWKNVIFNLMGDLKWHGSIKRTEWVVGHQFMLINAD